MQYCGQNPSLENYSFRKLVTFPYLGSKQILTVLPEFNGIIDQKIPFEFERNGLFSLSCYTSKTHHLIQTPNFLMIKKTLFLFVFCRLLCQQDDAFSQFHHAPLSLNPALVGAFDEDQRFGATLSQPMVQRSGSIRNLLRCHSQKVFQPWLGDNWLGWEGRSLYDQAGDAALSWLQLALHGAFFNWRADEHILSAGLQLRFGSALEPYHQFWWTSSDNVFDPGTPNLLNPSSTASGFFQPGRWHQLVHQPKVPEVAPGQVWEPFTRTSRRFLFQRWERVLCPYFFNFTYFGFLELTERWDLYFQTTGANDRVLIRDYWNGGRKVSPQPGERQRTCPAVGIGYRLSDAVVGYLDVL